MVDIFDCLTTAVGRAAVGTDDVGYLIDQGPYRLVVVAFSATHDLSLFTNDRVTSKISLTLLLFVFVASPH